MEISRAYAEMGLLPGATRAVVVDTFRAKALACHPDLFPRDPAAPEKFFKLKQAYDILRKHLRDAERAGGVGEDADAGTRRGRDIAVAIQVPLSLVAKGGEHAIHASGISCMQCNGRGRIRIEQVVRCIECNGTGRGELVRGIMRVRISCKGCEGQGHHLGVSCPSCGGTGQDAMDGDVLITIPPGVPEAHELRYQGMGGSGTGGAPAGDLLVTVRTEAHPRFVRRGADILTSATVSFSDLVSGGQVRTETVQGPPAVATIAPGTRPGAVVAVPGRGLPDPGGGQGRLLVKLVLAMPPKLTPEQDELLVRWRDLESRAKAARAAARSSVGGTQQA